MGLHYRSIMPPPPRLCKCFFLPSVAALRLGSGVGPNFIINFPVQVVVYGVPSIGGLQQALLYIVRVCTPRRRIRCSLSITCHSCFPLKALLCLHLTFVLFFFFFAVPRDVETGANSLVKYFVSAEGFY